MAKPICSLLLFLFPLVLSPYLSEARPQLPAIPREFQNINFEQYLRNERAMRFQLKCIVYDGPCDSIGKFLKRHIPIFLRTTCKNCDEELKKIAGKFITYIQSSYPDEWDAAFIKYGKKAYTPEEIIAYEQDLGIKLVRDKAAPTAKPGSKIDIDYLVSLAKEGIQAALTTKAPLIIQRGDNGATIVGTRPPGFGAIPTIPSQYLGLLAKYNITTPPPSWSGWGHDNATTPSPNGPTTTSRYKRPQYQFQGHVVPSNVLDLIGKYNITTASPNVDPWKKPDWATSTTPSPSISSSSQVPLESSSSSVPLAAAEPSKGPDSAVPDTTLVEDVVTILAEDVDVDGMTTTQQPAM